MTVVARMNTELFVEYGGGGTFPIHGPPENVLFCPLLDTFVDVP